MSRAIPEHPFWLRALVSVLSALVVFFAALYVPAGLTALAHHDGMTAVLRVGLGVSAPLSVRVFTLLERWTPTILVLVTLLAIVLALVPARVHKWLAALVGIVGVAGVVSSVELQDENLLTLSLALLGLILFFGVARVLSAGWLTSGAFRLASVAIILALAATRLGFDLWARARLSEYDERWQGEAEAERARLESRERPVLRGSPLEDNAVSRYLDVLDSLPRDDLAAVVCNAAHRSPFTALEDEIEAELARHQGNIETLRAATRARHAFFDMELELQSRSERPIYPSVRRAGCMLVLDGHRRAQRGDLQGAAESYLDAVRFGSDIAHGPRIHTLYASAIERNALESLGRLVLSAPVPLREVAEPLARLESSRLSPADGARYDRLLWGRLERTLDERPEELGFEDPPILSWLVPYRALLAHAVWTADPLHREVEVALESLDPERVRSAERALHVRANGSLNPILRTIGGGSVLWEPSDGDGIDAGILTQTLVSLAWFRLVRAALLGCEGGAVEDPFAPGESIRCSRDGGARRFWSVGVDGKDDAGLGAEQADIVLDR
jgi:hypothetical protein